MISELIKLATHLDKLGHYREANYLDGVIKKASEDESIRSRLVNVYSSRLWKASKVVPYGGPYGGTDEEEIFKVLDRMIEAQQSHHGIGEDVARNFASSHLVDKSLFNWLHDEFASDKNPFNNPEEWVPIKNKLDKLGIGPDTGYGTQSVEYRL